MNAVVQMQNKVVIGAIIIAIAIVAVGVLLLNRGASGKSPQASANATANQSSTAPSVAPAGSYLPENTTGYYINQTGAEAMIGPGGTYNTQYQNATEVKLLLSNSQNQASKLYLDNNVSGFWASAYGLNSSMIRSASIYSLTSIVLRSPSAHRLYSEILENITNTQNAASLMSVLKTVSLNESLDSMVYSIYTSTFTQGNESTYTTYLTGYKGDKVVDAFTVDKTANAVNVTQMAGLVAQSIS